MFKKISIALFIFALVIPSAFSLYESQVGEYDWSIRALGDVIDLKYTNQNSFYFRTSDHVIGYATHGSDHTARVVWTKNITNDTIFVQIYQQDIVTFDAANARIDILDVFSGMLKHSLVYEDFPAEKIIKAEVTLSSRNQILTNILTEEALYGFVDTEVGMKVDQKANQKILDFATVQDDAFYVTEEGTKLCVASFTKAKSPSCHPKPAGIKFAKVSPTHVYVATQSGLTWINLETSAFKNATLKQTADFDYLNCGVVKVETKSDITLYHALNGLEKFETIAKTGDYKSSAFGCNRNPEADYFFFSAVVSETEHKFSAYEFNRRAGTHQAVEILRARLQNSFFELNQGLVLQLIGEEIAGDRSARLFVKFDGLIMGVISQGKVLWRRDDSVSKATHAIVMSYPDPAINKEHDYITAVDESGNSLHTIIPNLIVRWNMHIRTLTRAAQDFVTHFDKYVKKYTLLLTGQKDTEVRNEYDSFYSLKKQIIFGTSTSVVIAYDSNTGNPDWKIYVEGNWKITNLMKFQQQLEGLPLLLVFLTSTKNPNENKIIYIDTTAGKAVDEQLLSTNKKFLSKVTVDKIDHLVFLDESTKTLVTDGKIPKEHFDQFSLLWTNSSAKTVTGYKVTDLKLSPFWTLRFDQTEEIMEVKKWNLDPSSELYDELVAEDEKVLFKNIDLNNYAILTKVPGISLQLYVVNAGSGRVLFNKRQRLVDFTRPINMLFDENTVIVSYYNIQSLYSELWVVEFYKTQIQSNFVEIIEKNLLGKLDEINPQTVYHTAETNVVHFQQKYVFPHGVKSLSALQTQRGITRKNIVVVTDHFQVFALLYSLDRLLLSTRRPLVVGKTPVPVDKHSFGSSDLPPYSPMLFISSLSAISYYNQLNGIYGMIVSPTKFESTSLLVAYGRDVFFTRLSPEKSYDMLNDDFKYLYLLASVVVVVAGLIVMKNLAKASKIAKHFVR